MGGFPLVEGGGPALVEEDGLPQVKEGGPALVEEGGLWVSVEGRLVLEGSSESELAVVVGWQKGSGDCWPGLI